MKNLCVLNLMLCSLTAAVVADDAGMFQICVALSPARHAQAGVLRRFSCSAQLVASAADLSRACKVGDRLGEGLGLFGIAAENAHVLTIAEVGDSYEIVPLAL